MSLGLEVRVGDLGRGALVCYSTRGRRGQRMLTVHVAPDATAEELSVLHPEIAAMVAAEIAKRDEAR